MVITHLLEDLMVAGNVSPDTYYIAIKSVDFKGFSSNRFAVQIEQLNCQVDKKLGDQKSGNNFCLPVLPKAWP